MEKTSKELLREFVNSQNFTSTTDIFNAMKKLFSDVLQQVMEAELEEKLGYEKSERVSRDGENISSKNYRNGYSKKSIKTQLGEIDVKIPRDRNDEYEPQIIGKYSRNADGMEEKILALYSCGMSQRDIAEQIRNLYNVEISDTLVSKIVEKITPEISVWQNRALNPVYPCSDRCVRSWEENWDILTTFFAYPAEIRKIIYTTNIIEGLNRQFRKITKNKPSFTNDDSLRKILYPASKNIVGHWSVTCRNRDMIKPGWA